MNIQEIEINKVIPYHNNPRKNQTIDAIASSINEYGFQQPIVVDKNMVVIVGHTRLLGAKKLGLDKVPIQIADLTQAQAKAYRIADNKLNEGSEWDYTKLHNELAELLDDNYDITNLGFHPQELDDFLNDTYDGDAEQGIETVENHSASGVIIQYNIIFDDDDQQQTWFNFIKFLKAHYPDMDTIGERLTEFIKTHGKS
jgi:hypothetical protein